MAGGELQTAWLVLQQVGVYRGRQLAGHAVLLHGVLSVTTELFGKFAILPVKICSDLPSIGFTISVCVRQRETF